MGQRILLLGHGKTAGLALAAMALRLNIEPMAMNWDSFSVRLFGRKNRPHLVLADVDNMPDIPVEALCQSLRKHIGVDLPILAVMSSRKFQDMAKLLDAGVSDCLPTLPDEEVFERKITRWLGGQRLTTTNSQSEDENMPAALAKAFAVSSNWKTLGNLAAIHAGVAPRHHLFRRMAPPDSSWKGVLTADGMARFSAGKPELYLRWTRLHLFRLPDPVEYSAKEKVVVRRAGPPMVAAVDRSESPAGPDVYALIPATGITAEFITCLLNSRLVDFYFNRLTKADATRGRLRLDQLRRLPVPEPAQEVITELTRTARLLAHFGISPQSWIDRQRRDELLESMDDAIFSLYGIGQGARQELTSLHF